MRFTDAITYLFTHLLIYLYVYVLVLQLLCQLVWPAYLKKEFSIPRMKIKKH